MSYSIGEWFDDTVKNDVFELSECFKKDNQEIENLDIFLQYLERWCNKDYKADEFKSKLLHIILEKEDSLHNQIETCFNLLNQYNDNMEIKKLEYKDNMNIVKVNYNDIESEVNDEGDL